MTAATDGPAAEEPLPTLSVVVPAKDAADQLAETLPALTASDLPRERWELIVVDDASDDETPLVAAAHADTVIRLPPPARGPAYARNRGFESSRGECVVFVDADVRVHWDALRLFAETLRDHPEVGAVFGSYDDRPAAPGLVSQFRNLMHHHVHQENAGEAETFWAGCGAVRRQVFEDAGMYDEWHYAEPQIEDIELGRRIRRLGHRILLRPDVQGTHLKRWTLGEMIRTDLLKRGMPWTRLLIREGSGGATRALNLRTSEKVATAAVAGAVAAVGGAILLGQTWPLRITAVALAVVVASNLRFYTRLARIHGLWFPLASLPLHLGYYLNNAVSAAAGWIAHQTVGAPSPSPAAAAFREVGLETWPPVPAPPDRSLWSRGGAGAGSPPPGSTESEAQAPPPSDGHTGPEPPETGKRRLGPTGSRARSDPGARSGAGPARSPGEEGPGPEAAREEDDGPQLAFQPLHKRAFGIATGTAAAVPTFLATAHQVLFRPDAHFPLELLAQYFHGYSVSWEGAFVGAGWAFFVGAVAGWFLTFTRNLVLAASVFGFHAPGDGRPTRGFLDHV